MELVCIDFVIAGLFTCAINECKEGRGENSEDCTSSVAHLWRVKIVKSCWLIKDRAKLPRWGAFDSQANAEIKKKHSDKNAHSGFLTHQHRGEACAWVTMHTLLLAIIYSHLAASFQSLVFGGGWSSSQFPSGERQRTPAHYRANIEGQTTIHTHIHT